MAAAAFQWVLPVSRRAVALRQPTGRDEMLLLEAGGPEPGRAIAFADALACEPLDAAALPVPDLDALLLRLRQVLIGNRVVMECTCPAASCRARVDIAFGITDYLAHHAPGKPRQGRWRCTPCKEPPGWFELRNGPAAVRFRLPTAGDERDTADTPDGAALLAQRCLSPLPGPPGGRRAAEMAMAAMAPSLAGVLSGTCPHCGTAVAAAFDPRRYVLTELRARARFIAEDLHTLALHYHWSERAILELPTPRRAAYADMARSAA
jgi:hypothetical protein